MRQKASEHEVLAYSLHGLRFAIVENKFEETGETSKRSWLVGDRAPVKIRL